MRVKIPEIGTMSKIVILYWVDLVLAAHEESNVQPARSLSSQSHAVRTCGTPLQTVNE